MVFTAFKTLHSSQLTDTAQQTKNISDTTHTLSFHLQHSAWEVSKIYYFHPVEENAQQMLKL
jgi:hypothetical protein